jgi:hypothetical protein
MAPPDLDYLAAATARALIVDQAGASLIPRSGPVTLQDMRPLAAEGKHDWGRFAAWTLLGVAWGFTFVGIASIGLLILPLALVGTAVISRTDSSFSGLPGALTGLGVAPLLVAYLNRHGPGDVCTHTATGGSCGQEWNPWPWLLAGMALITAGILWFRARARRAH